MIVIIDYKIGNVGSIHNMLKKVGVPSKLSSVEEDIRQANGLILSGVGAFDGAMKKLLDSSLLSIITERVQEHKVPILGICVGMQLLSMGSEEGNVEGLGWIDGVTRRIRFLTGEERKVPHMGWNFVKPLKSNPLIEGLGNSRFYFVHSYHLVCADKSDMLLQTNYGGLLTAAIQRGNIYGTQFHPEKSHKFGMKLLSNFAKVAGC